MKCKWWWNRFSHLCKCTFSSSSRRATTAGCVARTVTARNSGSSTSPPKNTKSAFSTRTTIRTAGSTVFPPALLKFARGELTEGAAEALRRSAGRRLCCQVCSAFTFMDNKDTKTQMSLGKGSVLCVCVFFYIYFTKNSIYIAVVHRIFIKSLDWH